MMALKLPQPLTELYSPLNRGLPASDLMMKYDDVFMNIEITREQVNECQFMSRFQKIAK